MKKTKLEMDMFYLADYIELVGTFELSKKLNLNNLGDSSGDRAVIQKCYREMGKENFEGTVIDYLCWISTQFILTTAKNNLGDSRSTTDYAKYITKNYNLYMTDTKNLLRLFNKIPTYLINWIHFDNKKENEERESEKRQDKITEKISVEVFYDDMECFRLLSGFWYVLYLTEIYSRTNGVEMAVKFFNHQMKTYFLD